MKKETKKIALIAVGMVFLLYLLVAIFHPMIYMTNDDTSIQNLLSGNTTGEPFITHQFINVILGILISSLYKIFPQVQWWYWYSQVLMVMGILLLHFVILKIGHEKKIRLPMSMILLVALDMAFLKYPIANVAFTVVPAILGVGLIASIFFLETCTNKKVHKIIWGVVAIGYILVVMHRDSSAIVLLCYILLAILHYIVVKRGVNRKTLLQFAIIAAAFLGVTFCFMKLNSYANERINGKDFVEYNKARISWTDYPKDSYWDNPELYEKAGWTEEVYCIAVSWGFLPSEITAESFSYIAENSKVKEVGTEKHENIWELAVSDFRCGIILLAWIVSAVYVFIYLMFLRNKRADLFWLFNNLGSTCLLLYLSLKGRMPYRAIYVVVFPAAVYNLLLLYSEGTKLKRGNKPFAVMGMLLAVGIGILSAKAYYEPEKEADIENAINKGRSVEEYAISNTENIYVNTIGVYQCLSPWAIYPDVRPANLISWGGSTFNSAAFKKHLEYLGLTSLSGETFKEDNVYFLGSTDITNPEEIPGWSTVGFLLRYLKDKHGAVGCVIKDKIERGNVYVYQFIFEDSENIPEQYYDVVNYEFVKYER